MDDRKENKAQEDAQPGEAADRKQQEAPQEGPSELECAQAAAEDFKRKWYAVTAEYENYRKRTARDSAKRYAEGRADVVSKLFPIADNLERALSSCKEEGTRKGLEMVVKAFEKLLEEERIEVVDPVGEPFDAETQEAIMAVEPAEGLESGTVKEVYRKGYVQDGKVLRFAQVVVVK